MLDQCQKYEFQVLSRRENFGVVAQCPNGCIHVCVGKHRSETLDGSILEDDGTAGRIRSADCRPGRRQAERTATYPVKMEPSGDQAQTARLLPGAGLMERRSARAPGPPVPTNQEIRYEESKPDRVPIGTGPDGRISACPFHLGCNREIRRRKPTSQVLLQRDCEPGFCRVPGPADPPAGLASHL